MILSSLLVCICIDWLSMKCFVVQACLTWKCGTTIWGEWPVNLFIKDYQEPCFFLFMLLKLFCMMFSMQYARLVVSSRLSLAVSMLKMKLLVFKYLIIDVFFLSICGYIHVILSGIHHVQVTAGVKPKVNKSDVCDE